MEELRRSDTAVGLAGLAVLRRLPHDPRGIREVRRLLAAAIEKDTPEPPAREVGIDAGYEEWADTYDDGTNPIVAIEQPEVDAILRGIEAGRALDAGCGTGRWSSRLAAKGWEVLGLDANPAMLRRARANAPIVDFAIGSIEDLPLPGDSVDLCVCALTLTHLHTIDRAIAELARVTSPGGTVVISDVHPFVVETGAHIVFAAGDSERRFIRNFTHLHSEYISAASAAGLELRSCAEPLVKPELSNNPLADDLPALLLHKALDGLPGALIWVFRVPL